MKNLSWVERAILGAVCALVIGVYALVAHSGMREALCLNAADTYYNLQVQGFRAGQLSLKQEVPPELAQLANPYDPVANLRFRSPPYRLGDLSYYKGRLYLYYGVTPALILFWPSAALTGHYLWHRQAVALFCAIGFLASVFLLQALWRRYFAGVSVWVVAAGAWALGWTTFAPWLLARCDVYEVAISGGYMLTMLALSALWRALHTLEQRGRWLALASLFYGLALGARPSLLGGAVILLAPVAQAWRERQPVGPLLMAAIAPIFFIGAGLMFYNDQRFDSPFEFGIHYVLAATRSDSLQLFSRHNLWFNFRFYFLEPMRWNRHFPFVKDLAVPRLPPGYGQFETTFGVLTNIPVVWLTLAAPLAWRSRSLEARLALRWFLAALSLLFVIGAFTIGLFCCVSNRYEVDFLPALVLLAVVGILGLERALATPGARLVARCGWGLLLGFSMMSIFLESVDLSAETDNAAGVRLAQVGRVAEAVEHYERAVRFKPASASTRYNLGIALLRLHRVPAATEQLEQSLQLNPADSNTHNTLGVVLMQGGKISEAIDHYTQALRLNPNDAEVHYNLGVALAQTGREQEAIGHWEQALRLNPNFAEAHNNIGTVLMRMGKVEDAIRQYEQALAINPNYSEAQNNLRVARRALIDPQ